MARSSQKIMKRINNILKKDKEPILSVKYKRYDTKKCKMTVDHYCSFFSSINDESLWLRGKIKGTRDKNFFVRMPVEIELKKVISLKHLNIQDLINNTNKLARIIKDIGQDVLL